MPVIFILWIVLSLHAQTSRGTVTGTVLDSAGSAIPGARATLIGIETGVQLSALSNETGIYRFDAVDPGSYDLTLTHPGFRLFTATRIGVEANRVTTYDPRMEPGAADIRVEVSAEASDLLVKDGPLRGGNFLSREVRDLPLISLDPLSLARTLPGVTKASGSQSWTGSQQAEFAEGSEYAINGQRVRGNNYLLDGTPNNDMAFSGVAQPFNMADAVAEVAVQTGNFGVEFGRAGGGVLNLVTKSGTNALHGSLLWRYQSQRFNSVSNVDKLIGADKPVFSDNVFGFTLGGPIRKNKLFFFGGYQPHNRHATDHTTLQLPTADAVTRLRSLFPGNARLDYYLGPLGEVRGTALPFDLRLGADPRTGADRGAVTFASTPFNRPETNDGPQGLIRGDYYRSESHRLMWRYLFDFRIHSPTAFVFPGFRQEDSYRSQNFLFSDSYTFGPTFTNEFRFSYARPNIELFRLAPGSDPSALTAPRITIAEVSSPGLNSNGQFYNSHNFLIQDTQTKLRGRHVFRYGVEFLRQTATQYRSANGRGTFGYRASTTPAYSAFANYLDDFSGASGTASKLFGVEVFHPSQFHQSYFFQDSWKPVPSLSLIFGLRYENFGQPINSLPYPAFAGFNPADFLTRTEVNQDNNNLGPSFGFAWSASGKTVVRGGYQVSYDAPFTQIISLGLSGSSPNAVSVPRTAPNSGRGTANWSSQLPAVAGPPAASDDQPAAVERDLRNPYTQRWSFGVQRQLPDQILLDVSYVGAVSHKLLTKSDINPRLATGTQRLYPALGQRLLRTSQGNSNYHSLQARVSRRFARGFLANASYTWSKMIDSTSEGVGNPSTQSTGQNIPSVPVAQGGLKLDRAVSDYDRAQRFSFVLLWTLPAPHRGVAKYIFNGWTLAAITTLQTGTPFTLYNGIDRNNDGDMSDRPDISNPSAPLNSRAVIAANCPAGYRDPDSGACVSPGAVHWIQGSGFPNAMTVGRNTLRTDGMNNQDMSLSKSFPIRDKARMEFRWEARNAFNHPQFFQTPQRNVMNPSIGRFLNPQFTDSGIRQMSGQLKFIF